MPKTINKVDENLITQAIIMQQIVFKKEFSVLFDAVKIKNVQYFEAKRQPVKQVVIKKKKKKNSLKI